MTTLNVGQVYTHSDIRIVESKANTLTLQQSVLQLALGGEMKQGSSVLMNCTERVNKGI